MPPVNVTREPHQIEARAIVEGPTIEDLPQPGLRLIRLTINHLAPLRWAQGVLVTVSCPEKDLVDVETTLLRAGVDLRAKRARLELVWDTRAKQEDARAG